MAKDGTLTTAVDYALSRQGTALDARRSEVLALRLVDTFACALGGLASAPAALARAVAAEAQSPTGCTVLGLATKSAPEQAIFANTVAVRYLDYNDHYPGSGHPSDMVPALLAVAERSRTSGAGFLLGLDAAYEMAVAIGDRNSFRDSGFDQGAHIAAGIAVGISVMLRLPSAVIANAVAIAVTSTMPMRVTRAGELSDWKGCATAAACRNGYLATRLAMLGLSGPPAPFEGIEGLDWHAPPRGALQPGAPGADGLSALERTNCKLYPTEGNSQAILHAFAELRAVFDADDVARIEIETYQRAWHEIGGGQGDAIEKWDPRTRETADHSLPYLVAALLVDGTIDQKTFTVARVRDPQLRALMAAIRITHADDLTALHPVTLKSRIAVTLRDGRTIRRETAPPPGDWQNPMTEARTDAKYEAMGRLVAPPQAVAALREALRELPSAADIDSVVRPLAAICPQPAQT